jgi:GntR family transcriptional repressor for pyruvate dehydrogenase complex
MAPSTLKRVRRQNVGAQVFEQLKAQILRRAWLPGTRMPSENQLSRSLGVSRISVREALRMLFGLGLVETRQGGGTFVKPYSGEVLLSPLLPMLALETADLVHVMEYRRIVERGTAALAAERAGEAELAELKAAYGAMRRCRGSLEGFARADLAFHLALARATRNPILVKINAVIRDILAQSMERIVGALGTADGLSYHRRIVAALEARDAALAAGLMEEHVVRTIERLKEAPGG